MKFIFRILLSGLFTYLLSFYTPWWIVFAVCFLVAFILHGNSLVVFISSFLGAGLVWLLYAWYLDASTESILTDKLVQLFPFEQGIFLLVLSGLIGGVCGGFGALTGNSFRHLFIKKKSQGGYGS